MFGCQSSEWNYVTMELHGFFSQKHYDFNRAHLSDIALEIIRINYLYPYVVAAYLAAYFYKADGTEVLVTHVMYDEPLQLYARKWDDIVDLGVIVGFSRYPDI